MKRLVEWVAALIGAFNCIIISIAFAQPMQWGFPLPALYLVEIALLGLAVVGFVGARPGLGTNWNVIPWVAAGITLAFVVLGGFSIGLFLLPALFAFAVTGLMADLQTESSIGRHAGLLFIASVAQGSVMALLVSLA